MIMNAIVDIKVHAMTTVMDAMAFGADVLIHVIGNVKHVLASNVLNLVIVLMMESVIKESKFILHKNMSSDIFFIFF